MWDGALGLRKRRQVGRVSPWLQSRVPTGMTGDTAMAPESGQGSGMGKPSSRAEGQAGVWVTQHHFSQAGRVDKVR